MGEDDRKISLNTENVLIEPLLNTLSRKLEKTILYEPLPSVSVTIRVHNAKLEDVLNLILVKLPSFSLERIGDGYYISKNPTSNVSKRNVDIFTISESVVKTEDEEEKKFSLNVQKANFITILDVLFKKAQKEYSLLAKTNIQIENLYYQNKTFEDLLVLILQQANCDFSLMNGIYYIIEVQKKDILKQFKEVKIFSIEDLKVDDVINLLPQELNASSFIKVDKNLNTIILSGTKEEITPVEKFIKAIDIPYENKIKKYPIKLKYIKSEELIKNLPPSVEKANVVQSIDSTTVFFIGSEEQFLAFNKELTFIDKPKQQIKYQILVIQRQKTNGLNWGSSFSASSSKEESNLSYSTLLSNIFNINFDVISQFGVQFAGSLNAELSEGKSHVLADTTLNGISGEKINFSNTNTYRYRDIIVDTNGELYTSTTREIASGLTLGIEGWVSGDDMITVSVNAQVSKQGSTESSGNSKLANTTNPPSTSEKKVTTNVRTKSGEPIVIGGLYQQETDITKKKVPLFGSIPLFGKLFTSQTESNADTEFIIYLVPFVEKNCKEENSTQEIICRLAQKYMGEEFY